MGAGVVGAGVVGFGAAAGAVTVWVTAGAAFAEPHAARLIPAANAMAGIAMNLIFIFSSPPNVRRFCLNRYPQCPEGHHGQQSTSLRH